MTLKHCGLFGLLLLQPTTAEAQTFSREGQLLVAPDQRNTAAAQVAVAQSRLFGSMLVSFHVSGQANTPARVVVATREERQTLKVHPETFQMTLLQRERTRRALPNGALICRSYAPIDAIIAAARTRFPGAAVEISPPHKPGAPWLTKVGPALHRVSFDARGYARFKLSAAR